MNNNVIVSVIIPVTRDTATLRSCLQSLANMDQKCYEVILIGTLKQFDTPQGMQVKIIFEPKLSPSIRRNRGVRESKGKILCFIDDDIQVPDHWLSIILSYMKENTGHILGGPNKDMRSDFRFRLPRAIQENFLTEGLISHSALKEDSREVGIHDMPLCNMAMLRKTFEEIGGFNEKVTYYLDDVELNYIAVKLGHKLVMCNNLTVQHNIRPAFLPYFWYKWKTRKIIGEVFPVYYCLYLDSFQIKTVLFSYFVVPMLFLWCGTKPFILLGSIYFIGIIVSSLKYIRDWPVFICLPASLCITHVMMYSGFTAGLLNGICGFFNLKKLISQKNERFKNIT